MLLRLAEIFNIQRVLQLAFYRRSEFGPLVIDGEDYQVPDEAITHFRNLRRIGGLCSNVRVTVFDQVLEDRDSHLESALAFLRAFEHERCIVFLDPDTGLEPTTPTLSHVLASEASAIWNQMKLGEVFVFYQHQTNRAGQQWIEPKRDQLAQALGVHGMALRVAGAPSIANDVVFFYVQKE